MHFIPLSGASPCPRRCANCGLRATQAFTPVSPQELAFFESFRSGAAVALAGSAIISEQNPNGKLFTLYAGWAFRYKTLSDGRRQILNFLLPGDFIGLQQEFADGASHGVEALTDTALCVFPRDGLWDLFRQFPSLGYDVTWLSAREEGMVDEGMLTTGRRNATERVAMPHPAGRGTLELCAAWPEDLRTLSLAILQRHGLNGWGWCRMGPWLSPSTSSTSPTRWACRWCTPTRPCGACNSWGCMSSRAGNCPCSTPRPCTGLPIITTCRCAKCQCFRACRTHLTTSGKA